mmetsp:Transcript_1606/g.2124  ORF Transcript_1606/g.2124 Transcript_1606/m.2124 type:complete len:174 (+) Transcript_1606:3-524(+)
MCSSNDNYQRSSPEANIKRSTYFHQQGTFTIESAAVVYNIALAYHILGTRTNQSHHLEKAMQFYKIAASIRQQPSSSYCVARRRTNGNNNGSSCSCCTINIGMIDIAILNNMGQLHHTEFVNYPQAQKCFQQMGKGLSYFNSRGLLDCIISKTDQDGFILNVMYQTPNLAAAA